MSPCMRSGVRTMLWGAACLMLALGAAQQPVQAQESNDYALAGRDWTGLSRFADLAAQVSPGVRLGGRLDYALLDPAKDVVVLVHPTSALDADSLLGFLHDGGRVLLADDFGTGEELFGRLSIQRLSVEGARATHAEHALDKPWLPVFRPLGDHPLTQGVGAVVANHPAVLVHIGGPVLAFDSGGALVYDMSVGKGRLLAIADASLFINHMLGAADNARLAVNAVGSLCGDVAPCRIAIFAREVEQQGRYESSGLRRAMAQGGKGLAGEVNQGAARLFREMPVEQMLRYLGLILAVGTGAYLMTVFPVRRPRTASQAVARALDCAPQPHSEFEWHVLRRRPTFGPVNEIAAAAILKEIFEELFLGELGLWPWNHPGRPEIRDLAESYSRRYLAGLAPGQARRQREDLVRLLVRLAKLPSRQKALLGSDAYIGRGELLEMQEQARATLATMGLLENYERLTSTRP